MKYLVDMRLTEYGRQDPREGLAFIENYILPSLEQCKKLEAEKKIVAGGPISGTIGFALMVEASSALELDEIIEGLPIWPRMRTTVTPLTSFDDRAKAIKPRLEHIKARLKTMEATN
jgi:muconolactone delta-isomerase